MERVRGLALSIAIAALGGWVLSAIAIGEPTRLAGAEQDAFGQPMVGINSAILAKFNYGLGLFRHMRVPLRHADGTVSGVGPLYNARSCVACHVRDGRGAPPDATPAGAATMVFGLVGAAGPDPVYGRQVQDQAVADVAPEGVLEISWSEHGQSLADGTVVQLRSPRLAIGALGYGPLDPTTQIDGRVAPQLVGLGLLEAVAPATILARADPDDRDGDGISGVAPMVTVDGTVLPGRFGWRGTAPSLEAQTAKAAHLDMGLSVPGFPNPGGDCTEHQTGCLARAPTGRFALSDNDIFLLAFYVAHLNVPDRRDSEAPLVKQGAVLFDNLGCTDCHLASLQTSSAAAPEFAAREIAPYTDLLLHDMGPGLAGPAGSEWRTPPLWGIGLTQVVSGHSLLLHDGRARSFTEAILWHDGEGSTARDDFANLSATDRAALIAFLQSL